MKLASNWGKLFFALANEVPESKAIRRRFVIIALLFGNAYSSFDGL